MCRPNKGHCDWCGVVLNPGYNEIVCCRTHHRALMRHRVNSAKREALPCPHPEKLSFVLRGLVIRWAHACGNYYYLCACGNYHLTSWKDIGYESSESIENYKNSLPPMRRRLN